MRYHHNALMKQYTKKKTSGAIGVEVEVEGFDLPDIPPNGWELHNDGSLRAPPGGQAFEYVFDGPVNKDRAFARIDDLFAQLQRCVVRWSNRTSIHVHVNINNLTVTQMISFMCAYIIFEDLLTEVFGGPGRVGNMFCLRALDAEDIVDAIVKFVKQDDIQFLMPRDYHYGGMNIESVMKHGSLEFRVMRGHSDVELLKLWIQTLLRIREQAAAFQDPIVLVNALSVEGPINFASRMLPYAAYLKCTGLDNAQSRIYQGVRLAQEIAYSATWATEAAPPEKKPALRRDGEYADRNLKTLDPGERPAYIYRANMFGEGRGDWAHLTGVEMRAWEKANGIVPEVDVFQQLAERGLMNRRRRQE